MATIGTRVFAEGSDKYLTLANEEYLRTLSIGNGWTTLQIGFLYAFTPDGTNNLTSCECAFGLCSSVDKGFMSATSNWIGGWHNVTPGTAATYTYNAGSGNPYFSIGGSSTGKKVNGVVTQAGSTGSSYYLPTTTGSTQRKQMAAVRIAKGSPNFTIDFMRPPVGAIAINYSFTEFIYFMESLSKTWAWNSQTFANGPAASTVAFDELAGPLDTLSIFWNKALNPMEVYGVAAYRFS